MSDVSFEGAAAEAIRERERAGFDRVAGTYSAGTRDRNRPARAHLLARAHLAPGQAVLDLCTGPGWLALDAAAAVAPAGRVLGVDLSPRMVAQAEANAREAGATNIEFRVMDAERLDLPDASFDRLLCSLGLMHVPDPRRAAAELLRVARPGARLAVLVWGPADETHIGLIAASLRTVVGDRLPIDLAYAARLGPPGVLDEVLDGAGWREVAVERLNNPAVVPSGGQYWDAFAGIGGLFSTVIAELPPAEVAAARAEFARRAEQYRQGDAIHLPAAQVLATATRPS
jgi:ubiquinone/menaquinone biosynthesis C-methylase UbiE